MDDLGGLAKLVITRFCGQFLSRRLRRNVFRCLYFKHMLIKISCNMRRAVFQPPEFGLHFGQCFLALPFAKFQKKGDLGGLAKLVVTRLCRRFGNRRLRKTVVRCLYFKRLLINQNIMQFAPSFFSSLWSRPTFWAVFLCSPLCKISENGRFGCPC